MPVFMLFAVMVALAWLLSRAAVDVKELIAGEERLTGDRQYTEHFNRSQLIVSATYPELLEPPTPTEDENLARLSRIGLQRIRDRVGVPVSVTSGLRSPALSRKIGGSASPNGHQYGHAADIIAQGYTDEQLIRIVWEMYASGQLPGLDQVITYAHTGHLHVGFGPAARGEFLSAFLVPAANGKTKTAYVPWTYA